MIYEDEHELFRESVRSFIRSEMVPNLETWDKIGIVDRDLFKAAAKHGFVGFNLPEQYGGGGSDDFRFNAVIGEELAYAAAGGASAGITLVNDITNPYFVEYCTSEQAARWMPGIVSGELITAIAMTEPGTGSDLAGIQTSAVRDGDDYIVNGAKTLISNGINSDLVNVEPRQTGHVDSRCWWSNEA